MAFTLPKSRRLRSRKAFHATRDEGQRLPSGTVVLNWRHLPAGEAWQVGIITTKALGGAVQRNRARRWIREAFRLLQAQLRQPAHLVFIARPSIAKATFEWVSKDIHRALTRAGLIGRPAA